MGPLSAYQNLHESFVYPGKLYLLTHTDETLRYKQAAISGHFSHKHTMSLSGRVMISISPSVALITVSLLVLGVKAQSDCTSVLVSLSPCLNYITGNTSTPSPSCCSQLAAVVRSKPECLCSVLDGSADASLGITIDKSLALELPDACSVKTPPVSLCHASGGPTGAPDGSPPQTSASVGGSDMSRLPLQFAITVSFGLMLWSF
uniref:Bifunctional inhibitor/plant lipid transfer protein/seed storage helical domain-containing protein n=1 Tax=Kalanchoe fedtschenkoi TaxID=63787 RepID=A0A7N0VAG1_KALFE